MISQGMQNDKPSAVDDSQYLLLRALSLGVSGREGAEEAWRSWREAVDLDRVSWQSHQMIPALNAWLRDWLSSDPARGIIQGMVRRSWAEAQTRLLIAQEAVRLIESAGGGSVELAGGARVATRCRVEQAIRPPAVIRLLISPAGLAAGARALVSNGWTQHCDVPLGPGLHWSREIPFSKDGTYLLLQWRLLTVSPDLAPVYDAEFEGGASPELWLLEALCGRGDPDWDPVPWQVDAALTPVQAIDWGLFAGMAARYAPEAFARIEQMRDSGLDLPAVTRPQAPVRPG